AAVVCKSVCLTYIPGYGIKPVLSVRPRNIINFVLRPVKHRPDEMVETAVHLSKNRGSCLLDHIYLHQKLPSLAHQKLARLKSQSQFFAIFLTEFVETLAQFFTEFLHIRFNIAFFIGHFESASEVNKFKIIKIFGSIEKYFRGIKKNVDVQNIAASMHMDSVDIHPRVFHNPFQQWHLMD